MQLRWLLGVLSAALVLLPACSVLQPTGSVRVEGAWARPGGPGQATMGMGAMPTSAVYFTVSGSGAADAITGAKVDAAVADAAEVHETKIVNGVAQMSQVARVAIPAGAKVEFKPGGYHVMLLGLKRELKVGDRVALTLVFEKAGSVQVDAEVRAP